MPDKPVKQIDKFKELAKQSGADTNERAFKDRLRRVATSKEKADGPRKEDRGSPQDG